MRDHITNPDIATLIRATLASHEEATNLKGSHRSQCSHYATLTCKALFLENCSLSDRIFHRGAWRAIAASPLLLSKRYLRLANRQLTECRPLSLDSESRADSRGCSTLNNPF